MSIFDGQWHSYTESASQPPQLEPHGTFSFAVNPVNGALLTGSLHNSTAVSGTVNQAQQAIDIAETIPLVGDVRYLGAVVFQGVVGGQPRTVACGRFILNRRNAESQEEGTWVITKP
jgi:hypothetical protein